MVKFDQIYTTYGPKTNLELLILYGFSLERNPFEAYEIRVSLSSNDRKYSEKKNFIKTDFFHVKKIFESMPKKKQKKKSRLK